MYSRDEHRYYTRRLDDVNRELEAQLEILATLAHELLRDSYGVLSTRESRMSVAVARAKVAEAMKAVDRASSELPPVEVSA